MLSRHNSIDNNLNVLFSMKCGRAEIVNKPDRKIEVKCLSDNGYDADRGIFVLRCKPFYCDNHPYFFWSQEANKNMINRCASFISGELSRLYTNGSLDVSILSIPFHLSSYMERNDIMKYLQNADDALVSSLINYIPEKYRTPDKFRSLIKNPKFQYAFNRSINTISLMMNCCTCKSFLKYDLNMSKEHPGSANGYIYSIYEKISKELEKENTTTTPSQEPKKDQTEEKKTVIQE
ncbi:hypothetical protein WA158_001830 [Blastocystis sp. Blastoise]